MEAKTYWSGQLTVWPGGAVFVGNIGQNAPHAHHAIQICVGVGGEFSLEGPSKTRHVERVLAISPDTEHQLVTATEPFAILFIDPDTTAGNALKNKIGNESIWCPTKNQSERIIETTTAHLNQGSHEDLIYQLLPIFVGKTLDHYLAVHSSDHRISEVLRIIEVEDDLKIASADLANRVGLSESRLSHLFREEVGLAIRTYLLWSKLQRAITTLAQGGNLTEAAHTAGFADSAHLTRTFRRMFGIAPMELAAGSHIQQGDLDP